MKPHELRHAEHMGRVHAVQRRSHYERTLRQIDWYEARERAAEGGTKPPLSEWDRDQFRRCRKIRDDLHREMVEAGQIPA